MNIFGNKLSNPQAKNLDTIDSDTEKLEMISCPKALKDGLIEYEKDTG